MNFLVNIDKQIIDLLKQLNDFQVISVTEYKKLNPRGSRFDIIYGLCKIHKSLIGNCAPFRPILSAIKTPSYNIAKHLVPILEPITTNKFTIKNSFEFAKEVIEQSFEKFLRMALQNKFFNFDGKIYKKTDGVAMSSLFGLRFANAFFYFHEQIWLNDCPEDFEPIYYRRYVDDIFALFRSADHLEKFTNYFNSKQKYQI